MRLDENVPAARKNVTQEAASARSGQEGSVVMIEESVALASKAAAGATLANVRSVHVKGNVGSPPSTRGSGTRHEGEDEVAVVVLGIEGQGYATVVDAVGVAAPAQANDDGMAEEEEMVEKLKAENLGFYGELIAKKTAHARALLNNVRLQKEMKKVMKEKKEVARLLTAEKPKRGDSVVVEQLITDVLTVTMKAGNRSVL